MAAMQEMQEQRPGPRLPLWVLVAVLLAPQGAGAIPRHSKFRVARSGAIELIANPALRLNVKGGAMKEGDPLILWPCSAQKHELFDMADGVIKLRTNPVLCLNAEGGPNIGARIVTWPCAHRGTTDPNEEFSLGRDGRIRLRTHPNLCINVKGGAITMGAEIVLWACTEGDNSTNDKFVYQDGLFQLQANQDFHLNCAGGDVTNTSSLVLWRCEPSLHEIFEFTFPESRIRMKHKPEMCVNAEGGLGPGARLIIWPCQPEVQFNERFVYDKEREVIHPMAIPTLAFNVKGGNVANGGEIILWTVDEPDLGPSEL